MPPGGHGAWTRGLAGISLAAALTGALGCAGHAGTEADAGALSGAGDGAPMLELGDAATPCDRYFAAMYGLAQASQYGCGPSLPAAEVVRTRARFARSCQDQIALPGSGVTDAKLLACVSVRESQVDAWASPQACDFRGSLAGGAPCVDKVQCQSGSCVTQSNSVILQTDPYACGICLTAQVVGEACDRSSTCTAGNGCFALTPDAAYPDYTCLPIREANAGEHCDDGSSICTSGLICDRDASTCGPPAKLGEACEQRPCARSLICWGFPAVCRSRASAGGACGQDCDCIPSLGCSSGRCSAVTWVAPGGTCDGDRRRCLVGGCAFSRYQNEIPPPPSPDGGVPRGTCPRVIPDGEPCDSTDSFTTCDAFSVCFQGRCALTDSVVCR